MEDAFLHALPAHSPLALHAFPATPIAHLAPAHHSLNAPLALLHDQSSPTAGVSPPVAKPSSSIPLLARVRAATQAAVAAPVLALVDASLAQARTRSSDEANAFLRNARTIAPLSQDSAPVFPNSSKSRPLHPALRAPLLSQQLRVSISLLSSRRAVETRLSGGRSCSWHSDARSSSSLCSCAGAVAPGRGERRGLRRGRRCAVLGVLAGGKRGWLGSARSSSAIHREAGQTDVLLQRST